MKKSLCLLALITSLAGCMGVPIRSLPHLMSLQTEIMTANPAEMMFAVQTDATVPFPRDGAPVLILIAAPVTKDAFATLRAELPMQQMTSSNAAALGLPTQRTGQQVRVYGFSPEAQAKIAQVRKEFTQLREQAKGKGGGTLSVGMSQEGLLTDGAQFERAQWESWLQMTKAKGFFALWSGTMADLRKQAKKS